jgi:hypothetical protein
MGVTGTPRRGRNHLMQIKSPLYGRRMKAPRFDVRIATALSRHCLGISIVKTQRLRCANNKQIKRAAEWSDRSFDYAHFTQHDVNYVGETPIDSVFLRLV